MNECGRGLEVGKRHLRFACPHEWTARISRSTTGLGSLDQWGKVSKAHAFTCWNSPFPFHLVLRSHSRSCSWACFWLNCEANWHFVKLSAVVELLMHTETNNPNTRFVVTERDRVVKAFLCLKVVKSWRSGSWWSIRSFCTTSKFWDYGKNWENIWKQMNSSQQSSQLYTIPWSSWRMGTEDSKSSKKLGII